ncbi:MAG: cell division protein SepF [Acidimicrobiales bacterium]
MKEKMRKALGFLGLIEDEYGEYASAGATRPFSEQPAYEEEPEWARPAPAPSRPYTTVAGGPAPQRSAPTTYPGRNSSISVIEAGSQAPRVRPLPSNGVRGITPLSQDRDVAIFSPTNYNESRRITDLLRSNRAVVMRVDQIDAGLARRLVDFAAGTAYALNAKVEVLEKGAVYLVSPQGIHLSPDARERLRVSNYQSTGL